MSKALKRAILAASLCVVAKGSLVYDVTLGTQPFAGHGGAPFYVAFQLTDGSGVGDGNNAALVSDFQFGTGGGPAGSPLLIGSAFGDMTSTVVLTDSLFPSVFAQQFTPGDSLRFRLSLSTNADDGGAVDAFAFYLLDNTLNPIPTTAGPFLDYLLLVNLDPLGTMQTFTGDITRVPAAGGLPIAIDAPQVSAVPEPSVGLPLAMVMTLILPLIHKRSRANRRQC